MDWQPIKSAPMDGTEIFLGSDGSYNAGRFVGIGRYLKAEKFENGKKVSGTEGWHINGLTTFHPDDMPVVNPSHWAKIVYPPRKVS